MNYFLIVFMCVTLVLILAHKHIIIFLRNNTSFSFKFKSKILKRNILNIIALFIIIYYLIFRWRLGIETVTKNNYLDSMWWDDSALLGSENYFLKNNRNQAVSVVFLLDWCSVLALLNPLLIIFDPKKKLWKPIGTISVYAAILTIIAAYLKLDGIWSFKYFFLGNQQIWGEDAPLTFILHYWMLIIGLLFLMYSKKINKKDTLILFIIVFSYIAYVLIMQKALDCYSHTSALGKGDYFDYFGFFEWANLNQYPSYNAFANMINQNEDIWWVCPIIMYSFSALALLLISLVKNHLYFIFDPEAEVHRNYKIVAKNEKLAFKIKIR